MGVGLLATALLTGTSACAPAREDRRGSESSGTSASRSSSDARPSHSSPSSGEASASKSTPPETGAQSREPGETAEGFHAPELERPWRQNAAPGTALVLVAVRSGEHEGFDRVVIEFEGAGRPGWFAQWTRSPKQQASGLPVGFEGAYALVVTVDGTPAEVESTRDGAESALGGEDTPGGARGTRDGEESAPGGVKGTARWAHFGRYPGAGAVRSVNFATAFEAQSQFVLGVDDLTPVRISTLNSPTRVVIDVAKR